MTTETLAQQNQSHEHHDTDAIDVFGFWLYIMTDCILFAALFAVFLVLNFPGAYGPDLRDYINLNYVFVETMLLLASNFTFGLSMIAFNNQRLMSTQLWLLLTFVFGAGFVGMEINEFIHMAHEGYSWHTSGASSSFFALVGKHGLHVSFGLLWIIVMNVQLWYFKLTADTKRRLVYLGLFWNFLDIVWIFLFSIVYLMRAI
jgi:cytochrome o ubiquinol oxidase subunit 3